MVLVAILIFFGTCFSLVAFHQVWLSSVSECCSGIPTQSERKPIMRKVDGSAEDDNPNQKELIEIQFSSHFLLKAWRFLMTVPSEQLIPVSGTVLSDGTRMAHTFSEVSYCKSTPTEVDADPKSTHANLRELDVFGHHLVAVLHSHPGFGAEGAVPSVKDHLAQERYQSMGYVAVSGIFSRDGYLRFFSEEGLKFKIDIVGTGCTREEENVFKLECSRESGSQMQGSKEAEGGKRFCLRPSRAN